MTLEPILLPAEVAPLLHVSERTLRRLKAQRLIRFVRVSPRIWGMRPSDIAAYHARQAEGGDGVPENRPVVTHSQRRQKGGNVLTFSGLPK